MSAVEPGSAGRIAVHGDVAPGYEPVADAFTQHVALTGPGGSACAVVAGGSTVVDLYAGEARPGVPWSAATRSVVFSASKGVTAVLLLMAADRGVLDLDRPVAAYWPEFGTHGKDGVTVRQLLAHRAGLVAPTVEPTPGELRAWQPVADELAAQEPLWRPGTAYSYHPVTFGFLAGEVLRRVTGLRPSEWLAREVAAPLGLHMSFGTRDVDDLAIIHRPVGTGDGVPLSVADRELVDRAFLTRTYGADLFDASNGSLFLEAESPAVNVVTTARDLARFYSATVATVDGVRLLGPGTVTEATHPLSSGAPFSGPDPNLVWGTGFMLPSPRRGMLGARSFGHDGAGGQLAFADPETGVGFGFQTSRSGGDDDRRAEILSAALRKCLGR